jgi:hypothetical protein
VVVSAEADQVDGGEGGQDDDGEAVFVACRHEASALRDGEPGGDGGEAQAEVRDREEYGEHSGSLVGAGERGDEADAALEARAEADSGTAVPAKKPSVEAAQRENKTAATPAISAVVPISITVGAGVARSTYVVREATPARMPRPSPPSMTEAEPTSWSIRAGPSEP